MFLVDCIWDVWSAWDTCSVSCGDGTQERNRMIAVPAANGGIDCTGDTTETHACNLGGCPGKGVECHLKLCISCITHTIGETIIDTTSVQFQLIVPGLHGKMDYVLQPVVRVKSNKPDMKKHMNPMVDWRVLDHLHKFWTAMMVHAQVMLA